MTSAALPRSGEGTIDWGSSRVLAAVFVAVMVIPVGWQLSDNNIPSLFEQFPVELRAGGFQRALHGLEKQFELRSGFAIAVRVPYHRFLARYLGQATGTTSVGQDGFLYYQDDLKFARGEGPLSPRQPGRIAEARDVRSDAFEEVVRSALRLLFRRRAPTPEVARPLVDARTAIVNAVRQFKELGLPVLVVIVPGKVAIYPEYYAPGYPLSAGPAQNRDMARWEKLLEAEGVSVLDLARPMWEAKSRTDTLLFLKTDSHWSPEGVSVAADSIAARAAEILGPAPPCPFRVERHTVNNAGDQTPLLDAGECRDLYPLESIVQTRVFHGQADDIVGNEAPVLLLGDSYTTMFLGHDPDCGAGLPAQLMLRLGRGVQMIAAPGITPANLLHELAAHPAALPRKKLVIWEFVDRTVTTPKAWETVLLPAP